MDLRELPPIAFSNFVRTKLHVERCDALPQKKAFRSPHRIPQYAEYLSEDDCMDVSLGFNEKAFFLSVRVKTPFTAAHFPDVERGDGLEVFLSTRGHLESRSITKFCHHFVILPKEIDGLFAAEVTRFRPEEKRDLAPEDAVFVETTFEKGGYVMEIVFLDRALYQYDPIEYPHMRFAIKLHRTKLPPAHFPLSSLDYKLEKYPDLWAELTFS